MVSAQLERILASSDFLASNRHSQFLRYVVEHSLNGKSGHIKQYTVAVEALGYNDDFDPQSNPTVRILARRLRRSLDQYYSAQGIEDPIRIEIPKGTYAPIFSEYQIESKLPASPECPSPVVAPKPIEAFKPSIAVMMFACLAPKDEHDYVATGLTEEIIIALTLFPDFLVIGPLSRDVIHRQEMDSLSIGQNYGVRFVLDGTIRGQGEMFRLTVRLTDTISGQQLWGQTLDCGLVNGSILESESNVVDQIVATIADSYGVIPRTLTKESLALRNESPEVYQAILHYYHYFRVLTQEAYTDAMNALEKAVQHNPDHALATAALGDLVASTYLFGYEDDESLLVRAETLGRKGVALDPNSQVARFTMALIHFLKFQRSLFLDEVNQCLQLNPNNAHFIAVLSLHVGMVGEWDRAMNLMDKAMRLNPHHPGWFHIVGFMNSYRQGDYDLALVEARRFNTPDFFWDPLIRAAVLGQLDRPSEAKNAVDELLALMPDFYLRGRSLIRRLAYLDEHVEILRDGLCKAGIGALQ
jgi:adenylate cyclase